jgi:hypothetical protein
VTKQFSEQVEILEKQLKNKNKEFTEEQKYIRVRSTFITKDYKQIWVLTTFYLHIVILDFKNEDIFHSFTMWKNSLSRNGHKFFIYSEMMKQHEGNIDVFSKVDERFTFILHYR